MPMDDRLGTATEGANIRILEIEEKSLKRKTNKLYEFGSTELLAKSWVGGES